ncbi:cytochrome P450 [Trametes elegans]|nr:cytochrome P450 [Trametes elegans]
MSLFQLALVAAFIYAFWTVLGCWAYHPKPSPSRVAGPKKEHWLTGNLHRLFRDGLDYHLGLLDKYGGVVKIYGMLGAEQLLVSDPLALHHILVKAQDVYQETDMFVMTNKLIFGEGLISTLGEQHSKQRKILNPVFSLGNMRALLLEIQPIANELASRILAEIPADGGTKEVDVLPWCVRGTVEYVAQAIVGVSFDLLEPSKTNEYTDAIHRVQTVALRAMYLRPFVPFVVRNMSPYWRNVLVNWLPFPVLRELREMSRIMDRSARKIVEEKKSALAERVPVKQGRRHGGKDLMTIMLKANTSSSARERLSDDELVGQLKRVLFPCSSSTATLRMRRSTFLLAGQETTTKALARILYMLACNLAAQSRLRKEVRKAKEEYAAEQDINSWQDAGLPYDVLVNLPYLDAVVRETLRVHPPTSMLNRVATKDTILPLQYPIRTPFGQETSTVLVPAGTNIVMSILGANHHKRVWGADASVWKPERWLTESGARVGLHGSMDMALGEDASDAALVGSPGYRNGVKFPGVYGTMMTFLGGGRACIGFKFAEMEIKQVISTLVSTMHFALPSAQDIQGIRKEIYWRLDILQVPVVRPPHGDSTTQTVPLDVRRVADADFL